ncbi:MAG: tandem-95 repeat protein [Pirellulales bacterium]|nr:tandem-95 repeat protein [Pirellulales bacterium]
MIKLGRFRVWPDDGRSSRNSLANRPLSKGYQELETRTLLSADGLPPQSDYDAEAALIAPIAAGEEGGIEAPVDTAGTLDGPTIVVNNATELRNALALGSNIQPGTTILISPGEYQSVSGRWHADHIHGTEEAPIAIQGTDPDNPPVFTGEWGWWVEQSSHLTLSNLVIRDIEHDNGMFLNAGDESIPAFDALSPSHHIVVENVVFRDIGGLWGSPDCLKMLHTDYFTVRNCHFERWSNAESAIDSLGCQYGVIEGSVFAGNQGGTGVGMKGGSNHISVQGNFFYEAGQKAVRIGGTSGQQYFRDPVGSTLPGGTVLDYEATDIEVAGNRFVCKGNQGIGILWASSKGCQFHYNTVTAEMGWGDNVIEILKYADPPILGARDGVISNNLFVFVNTRLNDVAQSNDGAYPETFTFDHNAWFHLDRGLAASDIYIYTPAGILATNETNGVYGVDPQLDSLTSSTMSIQSANPVFDGIGADAWNPGANHAPTANNDAYTVAANTSNHSFNVLANDTTAPDTGETLQIIAVGTGSAGGTITNISGTSIRYTPQAGFSGTETFSYTVNDGTAGSNDTATVTVTVQGSNTPPTAANDQTTTSQNQAVTANVLSNDSDADGTINASTVAVVSGPAHGTTAVNPDGTIRYTPTTGYSGADSFQYTVQDDDGATSNTATVSVTVQAANVAPTAADDQATTNINQAVTVTVLANDSDADGTIIASTVTIVSGPAHGAVVVNPDGTIRYTPTTGYSGSDAFQYTVQDDDGATSNAATVSVTVQEGTNTAPSAGNDQATTTRSQSVTINVVSNDSDPDGTIAASTLAIASGPAHGSVVVNVNGTIRYTPDGSYLGVDTFRYTVKDDDGATSNQATVSVTVENASPSVVLSSPSTGQDFASPADVLITAGASDADGQVTEVAFYRDGKLLHVDDTPGNGFSYVWSKAKIGDSVLTAKAYDNDSAATVSEEVSITVIPRGAVGRYSPSSGQFIVKNSITVGVEAESTYRYGPPNYTWVALVGDWNGDGTETPGLYDPVHSCFHLRNSHSEGWADYTFAFGPPSGGWQPIVGDWDGDGTDTIGLYNPANSVFFLRNANNAGWANQAFTFGPANSGWQPITGDWNGDGTDTVGFYDPATSCFYLRESHSGGWADHAFLYGPASAGWKPTAGDWNGDGHDTVALYNPATAQYFLRDSITTGRADYKFISGPVQAGTQPILGNWTAPGVAALSAAEGQAPSGSDAGLSQADLQVTVAEALARWQRAGINTGLSAIDFVIADLPGALLGLAESDTIYLDRDAAGHGWFVDPTPGTDEEFGAAEARSDAVDRIDLLTVVSHELGHVYGLDDLDSTIEGLMGATLKTGVRRQPGATEIDALLAIL